MPALRSSNIAAADYDKDRQVLILDFVDGSQYQYPGVPLAVYEALLTAPSPGAFAHRNIYPHYPHMKVF